ncbi:primase C terminal 2 (PriCT-2) [Eubacterium sp. CAG:786]|nr:primase C terminal 2 (PriCT-2) [Eubacterium sp. CAG:786]
MELTECLKYISPADLDYQTWVNVGMALKQEGYPCDVWDSWSRPDSRYHSGECAKKWESFNGNANPVTGATIVQLAKERGMPVAESRALDWDDEISREAFETPDEHVVVNTNWVEGREIIPPADWDPAQEIIRYLEALFEPEEKVGYVMQSYEKDNRYVPANKGAYDRTAGQLVELLKRYGDVGAVLGDYNPRAGAWIRFNPLDGKGIKNENVSEFRYALVESDNVDIETQNAIIRELELPVAVLVYSGKKSLHAIVHIDADNYEEYRRRVDFLYQICQKNGLQPDTQNRNPSRLSRIPGVQRGENRQYIVDTNIGKANWDEWREWIEGVNDDLPGFENAADFWNDMPELAPPLIGGVLRQGHKMLIAGPSKAGKSFALIELCAAIAEGREWLGWKVAQGRVLYVNLELDKASCEHRFVDIYRSLGWQPENLRNIDIWNLRGKSVPMDKLAPKLIRRAAKRDYLAIIIDPIYKVITGDENSADQMAHFCNQFDKVCTELGCAVIYCHHHSKGAQGAKRSMDRASGSGVFARDPDALLDLIELGLPEALVREEQNKAVCNICYDLLVRSGKAGDISQDDMVTAKAMREHVRNALAGDSLRQAEESISAAEKLAESRSAWRIEGTLREFPKFPPVNVWFDYPIHRIDMSGVLKDIQLDVPAQPWQRNFSKKKSDKERKDERKESIESAFNFCCMDGKEVGISELAEYMGVTEKTVRTRLKEHGGFYVEDGKAGKKSK